MDQQEQLVKAIENLTNILQNKGVVSSSSAAEVILSIVPIIGIIFGCVTLFFFFLWRYKINKELIHSGHYVPSSLSNLRTLSLLIGSLAAMIGVPLTIITFIKEGVSYLNLAGLIPLFSGMGFLLFYRITRVIRS